MGILSKVFGKGSVIVIMPVGKDKVEKYSMHGEKGKVLSALFEISPCTTSELADETGMSPEKVKGVIKGLIKEGYARKSGTSE